ncbi:nucleotide-diphospho-sugar transferase [Xylariaceae sp. FL0016]|nr:nucleotide-diphospho-sugar transferase [Xylariaceae sp. FL0016]
MVSAMDTPIRRYAYVTLITRSSYLAGVVILSHTLRLHGSQHPLIVLHTPDLAPAAITALSLEAARSDGRLLLRTCDYLLPPAGTQVQLIAERFGDTWTKLRVFELWDDDDAWDALCYLDADMAVFQNPDPVFAQAPALPPDALGASHACVCNRESDPWAPSDWRPENCAHTASTPDTPTQPPPPHPRAQGQGPPGTHHLLNGGAFLFRPSRKLWDDMMSCFGSTPLLATFKFPDQDFLAHFFQGRWRALGWRYNALKTMRYWHTNIWRDQDVACLHYIVDKPWTKRIGADGVAGYKGRDGVTHRWWWDAYEKWEAERLAEDDEGRQVVTLVRRGVAPPLELADGWADGGLDPGLAAIGGAVQAFANNQVAKEAEPQDT